MDNSIATTWLGLDSLFQERRDTLQKICEDDSGRELFSLAFDSLFPEKLTNETFVAESNKFLKFTLKMLVADVQHLPAEGRKAYLFQAIREIVRLFPEVHKIVGPSQVKIFVEAINVGTMPKITRGPLLILTYFTLKIMEAQADHFNVLARTLI